MYDIWDECFLRGTLLLAFFPDMCVYTNGMTYSQGQQWQDGCAYTCVCVDAATNDYKCDFRSVIILRSWSAKEVFQICQ